MSLEPYKQYQEMVFEKLQLAFNQEKRKTNLRRAGLDPFLTRLVAIPP